MNNDALHKIAQLFCDGINPALLLSLCAELPMVLTQTQGNAPERAKRLRQAARFVVGGCVAVAVPVVLAELGKHHQVWHGHPGFPSGHTTLAAAASAVIVWYRGRYWLLVAAPLTVIMIASLVFLKHHDVPEVLGGLVLGVGLATILARGLVGKR